MKQVVSIAAILLTGCNVVQVRVNPPAPIPPPVTTPPYCGNECHYMPRPTVHVHANKKGFYIGLSKGW